MDETLRMGGGAKLFPLLGKAEGIGGATEGGCLCLLSVDFLKLTTPLVHDVVSTSPKA